MDFFTFGITYKLYTSHAYIKLLSLDCEKGEN